MSVNSKMTAIADEIRELSGTTGTMGLDAMATHIGVANDEVDSQTELLAQVVSALEGKAAGGSSGGASVETCTVRFINIYSANFIHAHINADGEVKTITDPITDGVDYNVIKNTAIYLYDDSWIIYNAFVDDTISITGGYIDEVSSTNGIVSIIVTDNQATITF